MFKCTSGHNWGSWGSEELNPCQEVRVCQRCGESQTRTEHNLNDWKYVEPDSYLQERNCQRCSYKETRTYNVNLQYPANSKPACQQAESLQEQAIAQRDLGNFREARHLLKLATVAYPKEVSNWSWWGHMELMIGNHEAARRLFEISTKIQSYHVPSWVNWGILEKKSGNYEPARKLFIKGAKSARKSSPIWHEWAILEKELGYFNRARRLFEQAITIDSENYIAWQSWAVMEKALSNFDDARNLFDEAIHVKPEKAAAYQARSLLELLQDNYNKATELIQKAMDLDRENPYVHLAYGEIQRKTGKESVAKSELLKAKGLLEAQLERNPKDTRTLNFLGRVLGDLEEYQQAEKILRHSAEISSSHEKHFAYNGIGEIYWAQGLFNQAVEEWKEALHLSPYYLAARNNLQYVAKLEDFVAHEFQNRPDDIVDNDYEMMIEKITSEAALGENAVLGKIYTGTVFRIADFGAFVEILPEVTGLVHISQLDSKRVDKVEDVVNVCDEITVMVTDIDPQGKIRLSRWAVLEGWTLEEARRNDRHISGGGRNGGGRGPVPVSIEQPKKSKTGLVIGAATVVLLCSCCIILQIAWQYGDIILQNLGF